MRTRIATVGLVGVATLAVGAPALAAWTSTGSGSATGAATALGPVTNVAAAPTAGSTTSSITITWSPPTSAAAPSGYRVERVSPATTVCMVGSSAGSCTDTGLTASTSYSYRVVSILQRWNGAEQAATASTVSADTTAPVTTATLSGTIGGNQWYRTDVTASLAATDGGLGASGVKQIIHSASGATTIGSTTTGGSSAAVLLTGEGTTTLAYSASDNVGNVEPTKSSIVKIDKTLPALSTPSRTPKPGQGNAAKGEISGTAGTLTETAGRSADSLVVALKFYAGPTATGTLLQSHTAPVSSGGAWKYDYDNVTSGSTVTVTATYSDTAGNTRDTSLTFVQSN